nr:MAG TPA: hypothetical protein [Bacteriophage sp.]
MISIRNWFMRFIGKEVEAFGYNIPAKFKRACPGNAIGVYWEMPDGTYWFTAISGMSIQIDERAYERGTWFTSMMEVGEEF